MGVCLSYSTTAPVTRELLGRILQRVSAKNQEYSWWCESLWVADAPAEADGSAAGSHKVFCMIDDENADTWMAWLDLKEAVTFFRSISVELGVGWRLEMEGDLLGVISGGAASRELEQYVTSFPYNFEMTDADIEAFERQPRQDLLEVWKDR